MGMLQREVVSTESKYDFLLGLSILPSPCLCLMSIYLFACSTDSALALPAVLVHSGSLPQFNFTAQLYLIIYQYLNPDLPDLLSTSRTGITGSSGNSNMLGTNRSFRDRPKRAASHRRCIVKLVNTIESITQKQTRLHTIATSKGLVHCYVIVLLLYINTTLIRQRVKFHSNT